MRGSEQTELTVTWKITPLTAKNDPDGSRRQRQLQAILRLLRRASETIDGESNVGQPSSNTADRAAYTTLRCRPMATDVPQRELRNNTASLLRRVEAGERLRITVHGHPVAELVPVEGGQHFVPFDALVNGLRGLMPAGDRLDQELRKLDEPPRDPFA
jgi:prevent-host-death family protein